MTHLADTEARIALARGDLDQAAASAELAAQLARTSGNRKGLVDALLTVGPDGPAAGGPGLPR